MSDWVGDANPTPSAAQGSAFKSLAAGSSGFNGDYDGAVETVRSLSPSGPIHVPAMADPHGSQEKIDKAKTQGFAPLPTTFLPTLTYPNPSHATPLYSGTTSRSRSGGSEAEMGGERARGGSVYFPPSGGSDVARRYSEEKSPNLGSNSADRRYSGGSRRGSEVTAATQDDEDDDEDEEEEEEEDEEEEAEAEGGDDGAEPLPDVSNMSITQLCLTLRTKLGLQGGIAETIESACKQLGVKREGTLKADASRAVIVACTPKKSNPNPASASKGVSRHDPTSNPNPNPTSNPTSNATSNSNFNPNPNSSPNPARASRRLDKAESNKASFPGLWSPESTSSRHVNASLVGGADATSLNDTTNLDTTANMTMTLNQTINPISHPNASKISLLDISAMSLAQITAALREKLGLVAAGGIKDTVDAACAALHLRATGNLKADATAAYVAMVSGPAPAPAPASASTLASGGAKSSNSSPAPNPRDMTTPKRGSISFAPVHDEEDVEEEEEEEEEEEVQMPVARRPQLSAAEQAEMQRKQVGESTHNTCCRYDYSNSDPCFYIIALIYMTYAHRSPTTVHLSPAGRGRGDVRYPAGDFAADAARAGRRCGHE